MFVPVENWGFRPHLREAKVLGHSRLRTRGQVFGHVTVEGLAGGVSLQIVSDVKLVQHELAPIVEVARVDPDVVAARVVTGPLVQVDGALEAI